MQSGGQYTVFITAVSGGQYIVFITAVSFYNMFQKLCVVHVPHLKLLSIL